MSVDVNKISLLIIAGGKSSRMKKDKRWLTISETSFLEKILQKGIDFGFKDILICADRESSELIKIKQVYPNIRLLWDERTECGPMEGIRQGLRYMENDFGWAVSCDMPFWEFKILTEFKEKFTEDTLAIVPTTYGKNQPLAAIYSKKMLLAMDEALAEGIGKIGYVLQQADVIKLDCSNWQKLFFNVNTPEEYRIAKGIEANRKRKIPIVSISAPKSGTGKTTFIVKLIDKLAQRGIRCGVVKRDCHGFDLDIEGKDSQKFTEAGAESVAVVSPNAYFLMEKTKEQADMLDIIAKMKNIDLAIVESRAHGYLPMILLYRGLGELKIDDRVVAVFSDKKIELPEGVIIQQHDINDLEMAVQLVELLCCR